MPRGYRKDGSHLGFQKGTRTGKKNAFYGHHHSEKTKKRWKGKHRSPLSEFKKEQKGEKSPAWKGGKFVTNGYVFFYKPEHLFHNIWGYVPEHRLVIEKYLKRYLTSKERVHHINEIKTDNRIENLMVFRNSGYHLRFHRFGYCNSKGITFDGSKL